MRVSILILFLFHLAQGKAQTDSTAFTYMQYSVKGSVWLAKGGKISFQGITIDKYNKVVLFLPGVNMVNGSYTYKSDVRAMEKKMVVNHPICRIDSSNLYGQFSNGCRSYVLPTKEIVDGKCSSE